MSTEITTNTPALFTYEGKELRTVEHLGKKWFFPKEVCDMLEIANYRDAIAGLDEDQKGVVTTDTPGGKQKVTVIDRSAVWEIALQSRKPKAKPFLKWVSKVVLEEIVETGRYTSPAAKRAERPTLSDKARALSIFFRDLGKIDTSIPKQLITLKYAKAMGKVTGEELAEEIAPALPPCDKPDAYLNPTMIGKRLGGISGHEINERLIALEFQVRDEKGKLHLTESGKEHGASRFITGKNNDYQGTQILWRESIVDLARGNLPAGAKANLCRVV